nr:zinc finger, CCHC-type [Tanacetum cinerariifolium]
MVIEILQVEQEGIFCLGYKVCDNKFLGVQVHKRQGCSRWVSIVKGFLRSLIVRVHERYRRLKGEDTTRSAYLVNRSPSSTTRFKEPIDTLRFIGWLASIKQRMLRSVKVVLYRNMGFNKSGDYKKTFIGFSVGTGSMQVLQRVEFEVEPQEDHTFEVEPHRNVNHVDGSQEVQTQDLIDYQLARDREQHLAYELFGKWSDDRDGYYWGYTPVMFIHLFLYIDDMVFSCGCKAEIWATKGLLDKAKRNILGMKIVRDQSGYTLRVSQSRFYKEKLEQTLLEGHSILSLKGNLSGDCDVEKNGKWSCIYAVGTQEYQMVCTILDIAFANVESRYELRLVAGIATGALVKGGSRSEVPAQFEVATYRY